MSGYCLECGNDICVCDELEEEARKQPDVIFICQRKKIEEIQEQNKTMREALEKISTDTVEVGFYVEPTWSSQIAREALAKVGDR